MRRLVSEGTRPRLPWAPHITAFRTDPTPVIALLDRLKDDPERYVQRSAANNINDIAKDHPDVAAALCRRWLVSPTPAREWIVGHALRSLVKRGHRDALDLMGAGSEAEVDVKLLSAESQPVAVGSDVICTFEVAARGSVAQTLQIDYTVHFVKANGRTRPKTFKLRRITLEPARKQDRQVGLGVSSGMDLPGHVGAAAITRQLSHEFLVGAVRRSPAGRGVEAGLCSLADRGQPVVVRRRVGPHWEGP